MQSVQLLAAFNFCTNVTHEMSKLRIIYSSLISLSIHKMRKSFRYGTDAFRSETQSGTYFVDVCKKASLFTTVFVSYLTVQFLAKPGNAHFMCNDELCIYVFLLCIIIHPRLFPAVCISDSVTRVNSRAP